MTEVVTAIVGIAVSFAGVMVWLIKRQDHQIESLTNRFVTALETVVKESTTAQLSVAHTLSELTTLQREDRAHNREEHRAILDALGKVHLRESTRSEEER